MAERVLAPVYEIASEAKIAGRRPIKVILHEIFRDESEFQDNGISWREEFVLQNLRSVKGMSIVAEFLTEDRDIPYGHGMTDVRDEDSLPLFEDATMVGHFDRAYVDDVMLDGVSKRVLIAEGTLDEMRYPKFVTWLRAHMAQAAVKGSVEIVGKPEHGGRIIYFGGWKEEGRVPQFYDYSGYAILGVKPADEAAVVMELNQKNEEEEQEMDEKLKEIMAAVTGISAGISESNSKWDEYYAKMDTLYAQIAQLQADIKQKEADIAQVQADFEKESAAREAAEAGLTEANTAKEAAEAGLAEANAKIAHLENASALAELNAALAPYTEEQRSFAKDEIEAFQTDPASVEINAIIGKICTKMVESARDGVAGEINSAAQIDVFGMTEGTGRHEEPDDVDIF